MSKSLTPTQLRSLLTRVERAESTMESVRKELSSALAAPGAASKTAAVSSRGRTGKLPFPGYSKVGSADRTGSRKLLRSRSVPELQAALVYERSQSSPRKGIIAMTEEAIRFNRGEIRRGRPPKNKTAARRGPGRPRKTPSASSAAAKPAKVAGAPFPGWSKIASGKQTASRKILASKSVEQLEAALATERAKSSPRKQVIAMIKDALKKQRSEAKTGGAPFAKWERIASSRQAESRKILRAQTPAKLQAALKYEKGQKKPRLQVVALIEESIALKAKPSTRKAKAVKAPAKKTASKVGRPRKTQTQRFIDLVERKPGITVAKAAPQLGIKTATLYATASQLAASKRVSKKGPQFYPAAAAKKTAAKKPAVKKPAVKKPAAKAAAKPAASRSVAKRKPRKAARRSGTKKPVKRRARRS